jgi:hypothetical protein
VSTHHWVTHHWDEGEETTGAELVGGEGGRVGPVAGMDFTHSPTEGGMSTPDACHQHRGYNDTKRVQRQERTRGETHGSYDWPSESEEIDLNGENTAKRQGAHFLA